MVDAEKFVRLRGDVAGHPARYWAIGAIHGEAARLSAVHQAIARALEPNDRLVYLGNLIGHNPASRATLDEIVAFRRWFLARPLTFPFDIAYLRGAQEEMWSKLLQLQFAPNPREVLEWLLGHGVEASLQAYGLDPNQGRSAARDGAVSIARWTGQIRAAVAAAPGHQPLFSALKRAALLTPPAGPGLLFVSAGLDPARPLDKQGDAFWWGAQGFASLADQPYDGFARVIRGTAPKPAGLVETPYSVTLDGGAGRGGGVLAACFDASGAILGTLNA